MTKIIPISARGQVTIPKEARIHFKAPYVLFGEYQNAYYFKISSPEIAEPENWMEELAKNVPEDTEGKIKPEFVQELNESWTEYKKTGISYSLDETMEKSKEMA